MESLTLTLFMSIVHGLSESCVFHSCIFHSCIFHSCIFHSRIFSAPRQTQLSTTLWGRRLRLFGHIARAGSRMDHTLAFRSIISGLPRDCKRPPDQPRRTWLRTIEQDLRPLNIGLVSAWQRAQDRVRWKWTVETATLQAVACS